MKIFISYSRQNEELVTIFKNFIKGLDSSIEIACLSDQNKSLVGVYFVDYLEKQLSTTDIFIPFLTKEYYASRLCIMEFGAAVQYYLQKYRQDCANYIYPFYLYPVTEPEALNETLIAFLESSDLMDASKVEDFVGRFLDRNSSIKNRIKEFNYQIRRIVLGDTNLITRANAIGFHAWGGYVDKYPDYKYIRKSLSDNEVTVGFSLVPDESFSSTASEWPDFGVFFLFHDVLDISSYLGIDESAKLVFDLENFTKSLKRITVEFKTHGHEIVAKETIEIKSDDLKDGYGHYEVKLNIISGERARREITEIGFIVNAKDVVEEEGTFDIKDIRIKLEG